MKKTVLNNINLILGIMAIMFSGLASLRLFAQRPQPLMYGAPNPEYRDGKKMPERPEIIVEDKDSVPAQDTIRPAEQDTLLPPPPDIPMCKYGPPSDWW